MNMDQAMDQAEDDLCRELNEGKITEKEFHAEMKHMVREYQDMAKEAAREAYDREMERW